MLRFLRKYNKFILVVGGVLLMIVFIAPQAVQQFGPKPENRKAATLDGRPITEGELAKVRNEIEALRTWSPLLIDYTLRIADEPDHWLLLTKMAEQGGFIGEGDDGRAWIDDLADLVTLASLSSREITSNPDHLQYFPEEVNANRARLTQTRIQVAGNFGMSPAEFDKAIAKARGVFRMISTFRTSARMSTIRMHREARRTLDTVYADVLFLDPKMLLDAVGTPSEEELVAHFNKFKDTKIGQGEYGIGYILRPRVKFDYIKFDLRRIMEIIEVDPVDIAKRFEQDRVTYPAAFADEKEHIEEALRREGAEDILLQADRIIRSHVLEAVRGIDKDADGYYMLPEDWGNSIDLGVVAHVVQNEIRSSLGYTIPLPYVQRFSDNFRDIFQLNENGDILNTKVPVGKDDIRVHDVLLGVREIDPENSLGVQVGIPSIDYPAVGGDGERLYFMVTDARQASPPDSMEEVRELVQENVQLLQAYELLLEQQDHFMDIAREAGIDEVARTVNPPYEFDQNGLIVPQEFFGAQIDPYVEFTRDNVATRISELRDKDKIWSEVVDWGSKASPWLRGKEFPADQRVRAVPMKNPPALLLIELQAVVPGTTGKLRLQHDSLQRAHANRELTDVSQTFRLHPAFSLPALAERFGYDRPSLDLEELARQYIEFAYPDDNAS